MRYNRNWLIQRREYFKYKKSVCNFRNSNQYLRNHKYIKALIDCFLKLFSSTDFKWHQNVFFFSLDLGKNNPCMLWTTAEKISLCSRARSTGSIWWVQLNYSITEWSLQFGQDLCGIFSSSRTEPSNLLKIMKCVIIIPTANARVERIFHWRHTYGLTKGAGVKLT